MKLAQVLAVLSRLSSHSCKSAACSFAGSSWSVEIRECSWINGVLHLVTHLKHPSGTWGDLLRDAYIAQLTT